MSPVTPAAALPSPADHDLGRPVWRERGEKYLLVFHSEKLPIDKEDLAGASFEGVTCIFEDLTDGLRIGTSAELVDMLDTKT
jgi:hypothetical protein